MVITPDKYAEASVCELLEEAGRGHIALDQRWVHAIVDRGPEAVPELVAFGLEKRESDVIDLEEDLIAMLRFLRDARTLPYLEELVRRHPEEISDDLLSAFLEIGPPSLEPLLRLFEEVGAENGGEIAFMLAALQVHDPRVGKILVDRLQEDPTDAAIAISLYGDPSLKPQLEAKLESINATDPDTETERREISEAIATLDSPHPEPHQEEFDLWEMYPEQSAPPLSALGDADRLEFLSSTSAEHRAAAAESFANEPQSDEVRKRLLEVAKNDSAVSVRAAAWRSLGDSAEDIVIRRAMLARLKDESAPLEERCGALLGLSQDADEPLMATMREFYKIPEARAAAMEAMWHSLDRRFADVFPRHLDDSDPEVRRQAVWGVGYLGIHSEAAKLRKLMEDEDLREDALFAYALSVPAEISRGRIRGVYKKVEEAARGLSEAEEEMVKIALDQRLSFHRLEPVFFPDEDERGHEHCSDPSHHRPAAPAQPRLVESKPGRNDLCPCGSGKKYKKCCGQ